jgi:hypothetical protein
MKLALAQRLQPILSLGSNKITLIGAVLTTGAGLTMVGFWALEILQLRPVHPYAGIILFLCLPAVFAAGLLLMLGGGVWQWRRLGAHRGQAAYPRIDLHEPDVRHGLGLVAGATVLNVVILSTASYQAVDHMDSPQFCGATCHGVMAPEYTAYLHSPHSRVACVQCHIGAGASWFVRSKLSGTRQVVAVGLGTYSRPIPSPVRHLRPARETCEQCHWPEKFEGDRFVVHTKYAEDEKNSPSTTVLVLKIGGRTGQGGVGIHGRHLDRGSRISYVATDGKRQVLPRVTYLDDSGKTVDYVSTEVKATAEQLAKGERRDMDCVDCHNRPSHTFELPDRALDRALSEGRISPSLPYVKKQALQLLKGEYRTQADAEESIRARMADYYKTQYPKEYSEHRSLVSAAAEEVAAIYKRNVFPEMKVTWGTYPNNLGHEDFLGCFRCHDENHKAEGGRTITQDCNACHTVLAMEEKNPKILADLGLGNTP